MLFIVVFDNQVKGVFTSPVDAAEYCKKNKINESCVWGGNKNGTEFTQLYKYK